MNTKILGALVFGVGLIALSIFGAKDQIIANNQAALAAVPPERNYIAVADEDGNGIPDWRENLRTAQVITLDNPETLTAASYTPPTTLSGRLAIDLFEQSIYSSQDANNALSQEQVLARVANEIAAAAKDKLYNKTDINTSPVDDPATIRFYGERVAEIAIVNGLPKGTENEVIITRDAVVQDQPEKLTALEPIQAAYEAMLAAMLAEPVPAALAQDHVNIINAYNAIAIDISAMRQSLDDPLYAMTRLKRYEDDVRGLQFALVEMYRNSMRLGAEYTDADIAPRVFYFLNIW